LGFQEFCLLYLEEEFLVVTHLPLFMVLNGLNLSELNGLSNKNLKDRFGLQIEIKEVVISIINLNMFRISLWIRNKNWRRLQNK
jgi:hypothetical protein